MTEQARGSWTGRTEQPGLYGGGSDSPYDEDAYDEDAYDEDAYDEDAYDDGRHAEGGYYDEGYDDEGYEPDQEDWGRRPRWRRALVALAVVALVLAGGVAYGIHWVDDQIHPSALGSPVSLQVPAGSTLSSLAPVLSSKGVIDQPLVFRVWVHLHGGATIRPGQYQLHQHEPYGAILAILAKGSVPTLSRITIPEGYTVAQIAAKVGTLPGHSAAHFLAVVHSGVVTSPYEPPGDHTMEGLLFPDTYAIGPTTSDRTILQLMVNRFDQQAAAAGLSQAEAKVGMTPYQALIVASIVQQEAKLPQDRGMVARVVYNRLAIGMRLQLDTTSIYALGGDANALVGHNGTDVVPNSPYNTFVVAGLPPTPITNPDLASMQAALGPTPGPWLYFVVVSKDGGEAFATTYDGQLHNIALAKSHGLTVS